MHVPNMWYTRQPSGKSTFQDDCGVCNDDVKLLLLNEAGKKINAFL